MSDLVSQEKLNTEEAARLLGLSTVTVRSLVRARALGCIELGKRPLYRFTRTHIDEYLQRREVQPLAA
jgi:excisionase family DNA binding protein